MRLAAFLALPVFVVALFFSQPALAHVLKTDGSIGVILHFSPNDAPTSGHPTSYALYFTDTLDVFSLLNCECGVTIKQDGKTLHMQAITHTSKFESNDTYTFPTAGIYTMEIYGRPKVANTFHAFDLIYTVRVSAGVSEEPIPPWVIIAAGLGISIALLIAYKISKI